MFTQYLTFFTALVLNWSNIRNPSSQNCILFAETATPSLQIWTSAYQWAKQDKSILQEVSGPEKTIYYVAASACPKSGPNAAKEIRLTKKTLQEFKDKTAAWTSFADFQKWNFGIWKISIHSSSDNSCSCLFS